MPYKLEICVGTLKSAMIAEAFGADRIELCDNLCEGGTTPSYGMIKTCKSLLSIPFFPIIRPRGGDFVYSDQEFEVMKQDVVCCRELGCGGVVFGILRLDGSVDRERCSELAKLSGAMQLTFHRAFDRCSDRNKGLEALMELGFQRILTSGGKEYAEGAVSELRSLVKQAKDRIIIMPGSGITDKNLLKMAIDTGAVEFHSTAKHKILQGGANSQNNLETVSTYETDPNKVTEMSRILASLSYSQ